LGEAVADSVVLVTLPEMGESVTEGAIVEWRKRVGDFVAEGDPLVDVTTDKVDVEVPATASGVVVEIRGGEGDTVSVGSVLAAIDTSKTNGASVTPASTGNGASAPGTPAAPATTQPVAPTAGPRGDVLADQPARRMARRLDVDLALVRGSGPNGLILRSDVTEQAQQAKFRPSVAAAPAAPQPPVAAGAKVAVLKGPAAALTGYMEQSLTIPTATSFRTLSVDVLDARRKGFVHASHRIRARACR
jgi:multifunctional 2-oxoglutarate metabolism enzyme